MLTMEALVILKRRTHGDEVETNDEADDRRKNWYIDRSINLPFILSLFAVMGAAYAYVENQNERRVKTEVTVEQTKVDIRELKTDVKDNAVKLSAINDNQIKVMTTLERIERKR